MECGSLIVDFVLYFDSSSSMTAQRANEIFAEAVTNEGEVNDGSGLYLTNESAFSFFSKYAY